MTNETNGPTKPPIAGVPVTVPLTGMSLNITGHPPAISVTGPTRAHLSSPGGTSRADLLPDRNVRLEVSGTDAGRRGESWVIDSLRQRLVSLGFNAHIAFMGDRQDADGQIEIDGSPFVVQATTPEADGLWHRAVKEMQTRTVGTADHVRWIRDAIVRKADKYPIAQRATMILAVDARHVGIIDFLDVISRYWKRHGDPADEFKFARVWVVGQTAARCHRLG